MMIHAYKNSFNAQTIQHAFVNADIYPFNPMKLLDMPLVRDYNDLETLESVPDLLTLYENKSEEEPRRALGSEVVVIHRG